MIKSNLFKLWQRCNKNLNQTANSDYINKIDMQVKPDAGFTLIEMLVVVIIIGVLSAIAAPGWLAFTNRQRVNKVNDGIFTALQRAQSEAKKTKLSYSVSFRQDNGIPQVAVYPAKKPDPTGASQIDATPSDTDWKPLAENQDIKPEQITLIPPLTSTTVPSTITFDYQGSVIKPDVGTGITITVAVPPNNSTKRCVIVQTLLGAMKTAQDNACN